MRKVKENKETGILLRRRPGKASEELSHGGSLGGGAGRSRQREQLAINAGNRLMYCFLCVY